MPTKKPKVMIYLDPDKLGYLKQWAEIEHRSVNNLITKLLNEAIVKQQESDGSQQKKEAS